MLSVKEAFASQISVLQLQQLCDIDHRLCGLQYRRRPINAELPNFFGESLFLVFLKGW